MLLTTIALSGAIYLTFLYSNIFNLLYVNKSY